MTAISDASARAWLEPLQIPKEAFDDPAFGLQTTFRGLRSLVLRYMVVADDSPKHLKELGAYHAMSWQWAASMDPETTRLIQHNVPMLKKNMKRLPERLKTEMMSETATCFLGAPFESMEYFSRLKLFGVYKHLRGILDTKKDAQRVIAYMRNKVEPMVYETLMKTMPVDESQNQWWNVPNYPAEEFYFDYKMTTLSPHFLRHSDLPQAFLPDGMSLVVEGLDMLMKEKKPKLYEQIVKEHSSIYSRFLWYFEM